MISDKFKMRQEKAIFRLIIRDWASIIFVSIWVMKMIL